MNAALPPSFEAHWETVVRYMTLARQLLLDAGNLNAEKVKALAVADHAFLMALMFKTGRGHNEDFPEGIGRKDLDAGVLANFEQRCAAILFDEGDQFRSAYIDASGSGSTTLELCATLLTIRSRVEMLAHALDDSRGFPFSPPSQQLAQVETFE